LGLATSVFDLGVRCLFDIVNTAECHTDEF
jgi:hypothetical protein